MEENVKNNLIDVFNKSSVLSCMKFAVDLQSRDIFEQNTDGFKHLFGERNLKELTYWFNDENWDNCNFILEDFSLKNQYVFERLIRDFFSKKPEYTDFWAFFNVFQRMLIELKAWEKDYEDSLTLTFFKSLMKLDEKGENLNREFLVMALNVPMIDILTVSGEISDFLKRKGVPIDEMNLIKSSFSLN